jgi:hypothetical protein
MIIQVSYVAGWIIVKDDKNSTVKHRNKCRYRYKSCYSLLEITCKINSRIERVNCCKTFFHGGDSCQLMQIHVYKKADGKDSKKLEKPKL